MASGALLRNGRNPARKCKLNEKMLRSSVAVRGLRAYNGDRGYSVSACNDSGIRSNLVFEVFRKQDFHFAALRHDFLYEVVSGG